VGALICPEGPVAAVATNRGRGGGRAKLFRRPSWTPTNGWGVVQELLRSREAANGSRHRAVRNRRRRVREVEELASTAADSW